MAEFTPVFARRTRLRGGDELTAILAGSPPGVLSMTGGFPNPGTFPTDEIDEIAARLVREDAAVALQYTPCAGIPSVREYLVDRQQQVQGRRDNGGNTLRLSFSHLTEAELETAVARLAAVVRGQLGPGVDSIDSEPTRA